MKKTFTTLLFILLFVLSYTLHLSYTSNSKVVFKPIIIGSPHIYIGASRLEIIGNLSMKLLIPEKIGQDVKLTISNPKKVIKKAMPSRVQKTSSYLPRVISKTESPLDKIEERKNVKRKKVDFLKMATKRIVVKEIKITSKAIEKKFVYNKITLNENESIITDELIQHSGFKIINHQMMTWSSLLEKINIETTLKKLATKEEKETTKKLVLLKNPKDDKQLALLAGNMKALQFVSTIDKMPKVQKLAVREADKKAIEEEMVFIDYSKNHEDTAMVNQAEELLSIQPEAIEKKIVALDDAVISKMVKNVISREMQNHKITPLIAYHAPVGPTQKISIKKNKKHKKKNLIKPEIKVDVLPETSGYSYKSEANKKNSEQEDLIKTALSAPLKVTTQKSNSTTVVNVKEVSFKEGRIGTIENFELATAHDMNTRLSDDSTGSVHLDINLTGRHSVFRGTILKRGMMRTIVNLILEPGTMSVEVPVFSQEAMAGLLTEQKIEGQGGFLLVEIDDQIDTLDIDTNYEAKILYDEKFKEVDTMIDATFALYLGVAPGNTLLKMRTLNSHYAEKVIHIIEDEVLMESPYIVDPEEQKLVLMERNIFAKEKKELELFGSDIKFFNRDIKATQEALNLFTMKLPALVMGMRKYFEFNHLGETVYLGTWDKNEVEVPSRNFIENIMGSMELLDLKGRCLIQLNLEKEVLNIKVGGDTVKGPMNIESAYLDQDGTMSDEISEFAQKAFYVGDLQGLINIEINYLDKTKEYIQTFCSDETYLVEQL
jgi:hypothetical protein